MIMSDPSKRWKTMMKRLAYLRAEAADSIESFESSVKEIEDRIKTGSGEKKEDSQESNPPAAAPDGPAAALASKEMTLSGAGADPPPRGRDKGKEGRRSPEEATEEEAAPEGEDELTTQYKKLWRAIARLTHPDVAGEDPDVEALYKAASAAHERGRREELLDVAAEVGVQMRDPHPKMLDDLNRRCVHYEEMIRKVRASIAWQWGGAEESVKAEIVDLVLKSKGKK
jgi:hypothetical protein